MRRHWLGCLVVALSAAPVAAGAQVTLGLRTGWAVPLGTAGGGTKLNDLYDGMVPVQLDVLTRVSERLDLGGYAQYGYLREVCGTGSKCSSWNFRAGAQAVYRLAPLGSAVPWLGLGLGYEVSSAKYPISRMRGLELGNLQVGADFAISPRWRLGPYLQATLGRFTTFSPGSPSPALHSWVSAGVRGTVGL